MTLMRTALRLLRRIPDDSARTDVVRDVFGDTRTLSSRRVLLWVVGHRENVGTGLIDAGVASELEDQLRHSVISQSPRDFAGQDRMAGLADLMAETDNGKDVLRALAEDDQVMLSLLVDCIGETRGQAVSAAAIQVTKTLPWEGLTGWFGEEMLNRRVAEIFTAIAGNGIEISEEELAALELAADYGTGNRPQTPWERLARMHQGTAVTTGTDGEDQTSDGDTEVVNQCATLDPSRMFQPGQSYRNQPLRVYHEE
jgi:hypothetical protein